MEEGGYYGHMLLPGQRFCPMEDELLMYYLKPKVHGQEVPGKEAVICELDLYGVQEPWKIWERFEASRANDLRRNKDLYFFTQKKKMSAKGKRIRRTVGRGGTWKGQDAAKEIYLLDENQKPTTTLLGFKKSYTYKNKRSVHHGRWIMYEFELDKSQLLHKKQANKNNYVLCLLRKNDVSPGKKRKRQEEAEMLGYYDQDDDEDSDVNNDPALFPEEPQENRQHLADNVPAPSLEFAEIEQWYDQQWPETKQEAGQTEPAHVALQVHAHVNSRLQQFEAEPAQLGEGNMEQQLYVPTFAADEIMSGVEFHPDENLVPQMANWPNSFVEEQMNDGQPNTMEVDGWNDAYYSDFGYLAF